MSKRDVIQEFLDNMGVADLSMTGLSKTIDELDESMISMMGKMPGTFMEMVKELNEFYQKYAEYMKDDYPGRVMNLDHAFALWCAAQPPGKIATMVHSVLSNQLRCLVQVAERYNEQKSKGITPSQN